VLIDLSDILSETCGCRDKEYFWLISQSEYNFSVLLMTYYCITSSWEKVVLIL